MSDRREDSDKKPTNPIGLHWVGVGFLNLESSPQQTVCVNVFVIFIMGFSLPRRVSRVFMLFCFYLHDRQLVSGTVQYQSICMY